MALLNTQSFPAGYRRGSQIFKTQGGFDCCAGLQIDYSTEPLSPTYWLRGRNAMLRCLEVWRRGKMARIRMDKLMSSLC